MTYVQDLLEGMHINQVFLVKQKQSGVSKTGKNYYSLKLRDKTGEVDMDTLRRALPWLKTERSYCTTYDEVAALFGVHGQQVESPFEGKTIYRWWSGDEAYIQVTFDVHEDGSETWNVTQYDNID